MNAGTGRSRLDQRRAPIHEALETFRQMRVVPFDVPGHKRGRGNPELTAFLGQQCVGVDVNSMKPLDNLCHPVSVIREAEELAADAFGAAHAFLMVGGTTSSVQSMVLTACKRGDEIILPRNVHRSVLNALVLCVRQVFHQVADMAEYAREEINAVGGYYAFGKELCNGNSIFDFDTTKLSVHTLDIGLAGIEVYDILRDEYDIQIEFGDIGNILAYLSIGDRPQEVERLVSALAEIKRRYHTDGAGLLSQEYIDPEVAASPQEAFYAPKKSLPLRETVGAVLRKYPDLHIIHFDTADLRDDYLGAKLSHACVLRRCHDLVGDGRIHQFCIRSGDREEFRFAAEHTDLHKYDFTGLPELADWLRQAQVPVYLTIDLDCLDPSVFPGTGTPEAGGVSFLQLLQAIRTAAKTNIVAADVNELAPMLDTTGTSTATACKVLRELLLALEG